MASGKRRLRRRRGRGKRRLPVKCKNTHVLRKTQTNILRGNMDIKALHDKTGFLKQSNTYNKPYKFLEL